MAERHSYPPPPVPPEEEPERPAVGRAEGERDGERREYGDRRAIADLLRRGLEAGRDSFFPRDAASQLVSTIGDLRQGVVAAVAQEVGRFLRQADIAAELRQVLTGLEVEAHVQLRFKETANGGVTTEVDMGDLRTRPSGRRSRPSDAPEAPDDEDG